jgi:hypothetical protein
MHEAHRGNKSIGGAGGTLEGEEEEAEDNKESMEREEIKSYPMVISRGNEDKDWQRKKGTAVGP